MTRRIATLLLALACSAGLYATAGAESATPVVQMPPSGSVIVVAAVSDGTSWVPLPGGIAIPPVCP